jgi:hypothetical protein
MLATIDLGNWLNLKMVLYLRVLRQPKNKNLFNPKSLVARERCGAFTK